MPEPDTPPAARTDLSGAGPMESAFFHDLTRWREQLARSIARNNLAVRSEGIESATNRILFSMLFLRIAEDRRLIAEGTLQDIGDDPDRYGRMLQITAPLAAMWENADGKSLYDAVPMAMLVIDDQVLQAVFASLLSRDRLYNFREMDLEIVAVILSRYLTMTIRRSAIHQAIVVDSHDTVISRRFPPPDHFVLRYVAEQALTAAGAGRSRQDLLPVRVLDPACGTGMLVLLAYRYLLEECGGERLTFDERYEILLASVHGVDINRHAVAATRMVLLLLLCKGETADSITPRFFAQAQEVFRSLRHTILCGNPLIGPDVVDDEYSMFIPPRERHILNPLAWSTGFPEIFASGGFDAVIGYFPGGQFIQKEWEQLYFQRYYRVYDPAVERSAYFVEQAFSVVRPGGVISCCMNDSWFRGKAGLPLRFLLLSKEIIELVDISPPPAGRPGSGLVILTVINRSSLPPKKFLAARILDKSPDAYYNLSSYIATTRFPVDPALLTDSCWVLRDTRREDLLAKLARRGTPLEEMVMGQVRTGTGAGIERMILIGEEERKDLIRRDPRTKTFIHPLVSAGNINRYQIEGNRFAIIIPQGWTDAHNRTSMSPWRWFRRRYPALARELKKLFGKGVPCQETDRHWWEAATSDLSGKLPSIIFPERFRVPAFALDDIRAIGDATSGTIGSSSLYLLGLLNSRLIVYFLKNYQDKSGKFFSWDDLRDLPMYTPDLDNPVDHARHDRIVMHVNEMLEQHKHLSHAKTDQEKRIIIKEIDSTDQQIDSLVYGLYGLTADEIAVVESEIPENLHRDPL